MNYEQKYKDALEWARQVKDGRIGFDFTAVEKVFPELAESEGERIRKAIHIYLDWLDGRKDYAPRGEYSIRDMIAWLEKQGENTRAKSALEVIEEEKVDNANKIEPKFKVGDWIVKGNVIYHIDKISGVYLTLSTLDGTALVYHISVLDSERIRPWTIEDAKDGDVLNSTGAPFIYKKHDKDYVYFYCGINLADEFVKANNIEPWDNNSKVYPATKEQREYLFKKMHEDGYEWDSDKKELKTLKEL